MNLPTRDFPFLLLTPALVGGAEVKPGTLEGRADPNRSAPRRVNPQSGSLPEMRAASIRGQVRWWHRFAHVSPHSNEVWGRSEPAPAIASRIGLEILPRPPFSHAPVRTLPHTEEFDRENPKNPWAKVESFRRGIHEGESFTLRLTRLPSCDDRAWQAAERAVKLWLLLGGIGLRSNRATGSVWPQDPAWTPVDEAALAAELTRLGYQRPVSLADARLGGGSPDELRKAASDTVDNENFLGGARAGRRKPSPVKMKVIQLGGTYRLLLTAPKPATLEGAQAVLSAKPLGRVPWKVVIA